MPGHVPEAELRERGREVADAARPEDDQGQAAEQGERAEGHDQRRQAAARDEQAVQQAAQRADDQDDRDRDLERDAGRPQEAEDRAGRPAIDSTERSISPAMMIRVIGRAMIATSISAAMRFAKLPVVRKNGERRVAEHDRARAGRRASSVSQRASSAGPRPAGRGGLGGGAHRLRAQRSARWIRRRMTASALTATRITTP